MPFVIENNMLPEVNKVLIQEEPQYQGYGVVEENNTTIYESNKDAITDLKNFLIIILIMTTVGFITLDIMLGIFMAIEKLIKRKSED